MNFRTLNADEIECRVATVSAKGCSLLLYKDARADMNLLDETVGSENWQRKHELINGNLFCDVGILINGEWVWKQDVGTESYTEKEKGQASDSFKRACVNWGIGRELYTAPFIWIGCDDVKLDEKNGKWTTYDKFEVDYIEYDRNRNIVCLRIWSKNRKKIVYEMSKQSMYADASDRAAALKRLNELCTKKKTTADAVCKANGCVFNPNDLDLINKVIATLER